MTAHVSLLQPTSTALLSVHSIMSGFELPDGNGRDLGIAGWENMRMGFKFEMGIGWEWE